MISCENCSQSGIELTDVNYIVPTVFGSFDVEMTVCKSCKSAIEFCVYQYDETLDELTKKLSGRANQLRNKIKRDLK